MIEICDSHTHLDAAEFDEDRAAVIERALAAGVSRIVTIGAGDGFLSAERAQDLARKYPQIWASAGVHPHDANTPLDIDRLRRLAQKPRVVAIGETGLDYFKELAPIPLQRDWFRAQIGLALELKLPIIIHSRNAGADALAMLKECGAEAVGGVFHCFSENADFAAELRKINFLVSFPGAATFKKSGPLRDVIRDIPIEQIMVETDAPYIAPEPYRGKRCESAFVVETLKTVAAVKGISLEEAARATTANAVRLFNLR